MAAGTELKAGTAKKRINGYTVIRDKADKRTGRRTIGDFLDGYIVKSDCLVQKNSKKKIQRRQEKAKTTGKSHALAQGNTATIVFP